MLRARDDAQAAGVAFVGADGIRLPIPVNPRLHSRDEGQGALVIVGELAHLENVVRANFDSIFLGFASRAVDHWRETASRLLALFL